ncbi:MAG: hypothetical protein QOE70_4631 [Chthoniobacter sp.]|jgi:hypothetical protein|nr:hypothetical protein [Chthoniobacter sp.]
MVSLIATAKTVAWAFVLSLLLPTARGGETMRAKLDLIAPRLRSGAPALAELKVTRQGSPLLEGVFDVEVGEGGAPFLRWRTAEFALINGEQTFRVMLPPLPEEAQNFSLEAHLRFTAKNGAQFDLGSSPLAGSQPGQLLLGVCVPEGAHVQAQIRPIWQSLRLERFASRDSGQQVSITTTPAFFTPDELPASAIHFLALDAVLISGPALGQLRERQLQALLRWVDAGGSVCVLVEGQLESAALSFLNQLAADEVQAPPYEADVAGAVRTIAPAIGQWRCGLGRAVIVTAPLMPEELNRYAWLRMLTFLWKVKPGSTADSIANDGALPQEPDRWDGPNWQHASRPVMVRSMKAMLPGTLQPIPWPALAGLFSVLLLAIGPGEYFVLGWLRGRRWTWVTFPLSVLACSLCVLWFAKKTFGVRDRHATIILTDVGKRGRILRETRLDLLFSSDSRESRTEVRNCLAVRVREPADAQADGDGIRYEGRIPAQYTLCRSLRQWTPSYLRTTSLEGGTDPSGVQWEAFNPVILDHRVTAEVLTLMGGRRDLHLGFHSESDSIFLHEPTEGIFERGGIFEVLAESSAHVLNDPLFEQISPNGSSSLSDLALPGERNRRRWVIVASSQDGSELRLFRYLYLDPR